MPVRRYRRKPTRVVTAIQLKLDTPGLVYDKWGARQEAKAGDFLVDNDGDVYTVAQDVFVRTYTRIAPGRYFKTAPVWAEPASEAGSVSTLEGRTSYAAGDYLVSNDPAFEDRWAIEAAEFERLYEPDE